MTVTYLKDGRIEVKDAHDALLLSLAGIDMDYSKGNKVHYCEKSSKWGVVTDSLFFKFIDVLRLDCLPLYVPADVARLLVTNTSDGGIGWDYLYASMIAEGDILRFESWDDEEYIYMRRHNDRWNLLPEIEKER